MVLYKTSKEGAPYRDEWIFMVVMTSLNCVRTAIDLQLSGAIRVPDLVSIQKARLDSIAIHQNIFPQPVSRTRSIFHIAVALSVPGMVRKGACARMIPALISFNAETVK